MQTLAPSELKALFAQLVDAIGTQDAAGTFLGISRQRIGQLISTSWADLPTIMQVVRLEAVCGQPIVTGALARRVEASPSRDAMATGVKACAAVTASLSAIHDATADGVLEPDEDRLAKAGARRALEAAQAHYDATMAMRPQLKVVA